MLELKDIIAIYNAAISAIEGEIERARLRKRHARRLVVKRTRQTGQLRPTELLRIEYNNVSLELEAWERRLKTAIQRREDAKQELSYYKVGGSY